MFLAGRNQTTHRGVLPILPSIRVYFKNVPKSKKCVIIVVIENAKLKLLKCFLVTIMRYAIVLSFLLQQLTLETWGLCIFSAKCDVILRFQYAPRFYAHSSLIRFRNRDTYIHVLLKCLLEEAGVNSTTKQCCTNRVLLECAYFLFYLLSVDHLFRT